MNCRSPVTERRKQEGEGFNKKTFYKEQTEATAWRQPDRKGVGVVVGYGGRGGSMKQKETAGAVGT